MQQQVTHLHHLTTGVGQPFPQVLLQTEGGWGTSFTIIHSATESPSFLSIKCSGNSPFIVKVPLPHRLLEVRHSGLIKRGQPARRQNRGIRKSSEKVCEPRAAIRPVYSTRLPAEEAVRVEAGAGGREDVQEGMNGGGWVTQVQNEIHKFLREKQNTSSMTWSSFCLPVTVRKLNIQIQQSFSVPV